MESLEKLSVTDLRHIIEATIGEDEIIRMFKEGRFAQKELCIKCWECEIIEKKLGEVL